ncbi:hypothetical protein PUW25_25535 (plasmid) [Paenibacillus urinalis]|uniref:Uncharacterized protein n=1 Tax=Paenibacillus urinalis TaxID=521520 RepID=A0ABY7XK66_9BACL|nr:hypothetical protein [Paenibacillus urinalis]WDI05174.1 hypothetical protein PUW25_25535 [Paenibacillus urinalis]
MINQTKFTVNDVPLKTKKEAVRALCATANFNCLHIEELWCYKEVCELFSITPDDYWNDEAELDEEHLMHAGNDNWKPRI